ncbi:hypothetical protein VTN49DRAFT_1606 [Thermomyces lanuginosus]|uniref:uncharacterized protein n=1 Tax=Thermomyces lanuginosus TaxID=5541 RepID=UPI0037434902
MVVVAHFSSRWPEPIYIWDLRRNHVQKIGNFSRLSLYYVSAIENVLVTFERVGLDQPPKMQQTKWKTTDGQLLEEKVFYLHLPADCPKRYFISPSFCRISSRKSVAYFMEYFDNLAMMCLEYDHAVDRLSVRCANDDLARNIVYCYFDGTRNVAVCDAAAGKVTLHPVRFRGNRIIRIRTVSNSRPRDPYNAAYFTTFGDREVFGLANKHGIQLWFFNPSFVPDPRDWKLWNAGESRNTTSTQELVRTASYDE